MSATPTASPADEATRLKLWAHLRKAAGRDLIEVRITPHRRGAAQFWCVMVLGTDRREVPLPKGAGRDIIGYVRTAFPLALWGRAQDYNVTTGELREHVTAMPACLLDGAL